MDEDLLPKNGRRRPATPRGRPPALTTKFRRHERFADGALGGDTRGFVAADLATAAGAEQLFRLYPTVEILVNNLGIYEPKPFEEITDDDWRRLFEINVMSAIRLSRAYLPGMKERDWGRIVFISSESGIQIPVEMIHYGMTKTALLAVSRGIAEACAGTGVTSNAILPGPTLSAGVEEFVDKLSQGKSFKEFQKEFFEKVRPASLIKRFATTDEVASLAAYSCNTLLHLSMHDVLLLRRLLGICKNR